MSSNDASPAVSTSSTEQGSGDWVKGLTGSLDEWHTGSDAPGIVISPDVDGILSACVIQEKYPAKIVGIYTTTKLVLLDGAGIEDARNALWLDHDVSIPGVRCVGQHIVQIRKGETLSMRHPGSWNPNVWADQAWENSFSGSGGRKRDKFPYGTTHFLAHALGALDLDDPKTWALFAHADGTWYTADLYAANARLWADLMFPGADWVERMLAYRANTEAHSLHRSTAKRLTENGIKDNVSRSVKAQALPTRLRDMTGKQSVKGQVPKDPALFAAPGVVDYVSNTAKALAYISGIVGTSVDMGATPTGLMVGEYRKMYPDRVEDLDALMRDENIHSHAIIDQRTVSYTVNLGLKPVS